MEQHIYIYHEEFRGSIKGVNKYLRAGDIIKPDDVDYFKHHYPDRILLKNGEVTNNTVIDKEIYSLLSEQNKKIDKLIDIVNSSSHQANTVSLDTRVLTNGKTNQSSERIEIQDTSLGSLLRVDTSDIKTQGTIGETKTEGASVLEKIRKIKQKRQLDESG